MINVLKQNQLKSRLLLFLVSVIIFIIARNMGLFWDNVLFVSKMGGFLYEHGLFNWYIPDEFDPGHPPLIGFINALGWKMAGQHLWVSHLMMVPINFGFLVQLYILISRFVTNEKHRIAAFVLVLADPTISAELIHVSPEIMQLFFFLLAVNGIYKNNNFQKGIALSVLGITFFRGMMLCAGVFLFDLIRHLLLEKKSLKSFFTTGNILAYTLGSLPAISYVTWRILVKGYLQTRPGSPWESLWQVATPKIFIKNMVILANRLFDFGRIFIVLFIGIGLFKYRKAFKTSPIIELCIMGCSAVLVVTMASVLSQNTFGHRYFIAFFITTTLIAFLMIIRHVKNKKIVYFLLLFAIISGNTWIYPTRMAQGWSAALAHVTYFSARHDVLNYMDSADIKMEETATFFPNVARIHDVDLNQDFREFTVFNGQNPYVFYSNIYNLSDEEYDLLDNHYEGIYSIRKGFVEVSLLKKVNQ